MTEINLAARATGAPSGRLAAGLAALAERWRKYRCYRRTVAELSALDQRELADLGLSRFDIRRIALETVYGDRAAATGGPL